jgi:hypothetical protein
MCKKSSFLRAFLYFMWVGAFNAQASSEPVPEYTLKASYLFNFMVYTQWTEAGREKLQTLNLCVLGQDSFGNALNALEEKSINGAKLTVNRLNGMSGVKKCNLLFVTEREAGNLGAIYRFIGDAPILVVADVPIASDAAILLTLEGKRLVFDVNMANVRRGGLSISSKVLQLARSTTN